MRLEAITSLRLKHIDIHKGLIHQDGSELKTKFGKTIETFFFPVDDLVKEKLYSLDDPLFSKAMIEQDENNSFKIKHVSKKFWTSTGQIRTIFKGAFERVGIEITTPIAYEIHWLLLVKGYVKTRSSLKHGVKT